MDIVTLALAKKYADEKLTNGKVDLTGYAKEDYVDDEIEELNKKIVQETGKLSQENAELKGDLSNVQNDIYNISYDYEKVTDGLTEISGYGITKISDTSFTIEKQINFKNIIGYPVKAGDKVKITGHVYPVYNALGYVLATTKDVPSEWNGSNSLPMLSATENDYFCGNTENYWRAYGIELTIPDGAKMIWVRGVEPSISLYKAIYEPNVYTKEETDSKINSLKEDINKTVYTIDTLPTVTTGTITKQHVFSKGNRDSFLWEFSEVGSLTIPNIQVNASENDVVGIWIYCNQEMLTQPNNTDGVFKLYVDDIQYKEILTAYALHVGWNYIKLGIKDSNVHTVKFDFTMVRGNYKIAIDTIELNYKTRTQVLLSFDMSSSTKGTVYTKRFPLVDSYGFKATFCNPNDANISDEQLNEMWKKGWDWSTYGGEGTRPDFDTGTVDEWVEYLNTRINACAERGLFNPVSYFSPANRGSVVIEQALKKVGFKVARVACRGNYYLDWFDDKNGLYIYTFGVGGTETAENTLAVLDKAIETGTSICIFTHDVEDELSNEMNCTTEVYTAILDGIKERVDKGLCDVVTFREFYQHWCPEGYAELMENRHEKEKQYILSKLSN